LKETSELESTIENKTTIDDFKNIDSSIGVFNLNRIDAGRYKIFQDTEGNQNKYKKAETLINIFIQNNILKHRLFSFEDVYDKTTKKLKTFDFDSWTHQKKLLKSITEYAKSNDSKIERKIAQDALEENIEALILSPNAIDENHKEDLENYQNAFLEGLGGINFIKYTLEHMGFPHSGLYTTVILDELNKQTKAALFKRWAIFVLKQPTKEVLLSGETKTNNNLKEVFIETARYFYSASCQNNQELESIFTESGLNNNEEKQKLIKKIRAWPITHFARKNPGKATAAVGVLGALSLFGTWLYRKFKK